MKNTTFIAYSLISASILLLTACSPRPTMSTVDATKTENNAQSYALQDNPGYTGQVKRNQYGQVINPMTAPANQTYYFDFDSNVVHNTDYDAMVMQANYLAAHSNAKVRLEGNTDPRGSREYNIGLGWRRDQSVARFLEQHGVLASQIDMVSYGKEHPAVIGNNEYAFRLDRRVKLVYERT